MYLQRWQVFLDFCICFNHQLKILSHLIVKISYLMVCLLFPFKHVLLIPSKFEFRHPNSTHLSVHLYHFLPCNIPPKFNKRNKISLCGRNSLSICPTACSCLQPQVTRFLKVKSVVGMGKSAGEIRNKNVMFM